MYVLVRFALALLFAAHHPVGHVGEQVLNGSGDEAALLVAYDRHAALPSGPAGKVVLVFNGVFRTKINGLLVERVDGGLARLHGLVLDIGEARVTGVGVVNVNRDKVAKLGKQDANVFG